MKNIIKIGILSLGLCLTQASLVIAGPSASTAQTPAVVQNQYVAKSGFPSIDFIKRFGKHCTVHKNLLGRQVAGLCDDANLCTDPAQYKACYVNCIKNRSKEDAETTYVLDKLASCKVNYSDKEMLAISNQAKLRLSQANRPQVKAQTFEMPADRYQAARTSGINSFKSINPFSTNCTTHKNALGIMTKGVCDNGKQCTAANYKKCYTECVANRAVDEKTFYVLKNLVACRFDARDLEVGKIAKDVHDKYQDYELANLPTSMYQNDDYNQMPAATAQGQ